MISEISNLDLGDASYVVVSASVTGKGKAENQDSLGIYHDDGQIILAMADGLGSAVHSKDGSSRMVAALVEILAAHRSDEECVPSMIFNSWKSKLSHDAGTCDTTCKFIRITVDETTFGGIGDGWIAMGGSYGYRELISENTFSNQTDSILSFDLSEHFVSSSVGTADTDCMLISTDGFSEDFDKTRGEELLKEIRSKLVEDPASFAEDLSVLLLHWPVETNCDDKSVIIIAKVNKHE